MSIARWIFFLAGLGVCGSVVLFVVTSNDVYLRIARRLFTGTVATAILFFGVLLLERLGAI